MNDNKISWSDSVKRGILSSALWQISVCNKGKKVRRLTEG